MNEHLPSPNLNESDLLEFALRLATYPGDPHTQNAQLLPGRLPDELPISIPFPEGCLVRGSLIRNAESINMFLDTHLSPEQVLTFYQQRMQAADWQTTDMYQPDRGGFISSGSRSRGGSATFYQGLRERVLTDNALENALAWEDYHLNRNRSGPVLTVNAFPGRNNLTDLRLNLQMNGPYPPGPPPHRRGRPSRNTFSMLPALEAPSGVIQIGGSTGSSPTGTHADTTLETDTDLSTLAAHYKAQLEQAGCVLTGESQNEPVAWNTWTLKEDNEQWFGFFMILKIPNQQYYLMMKVNSNNGGKAPTEG